jgi:hypothetical protein
VLRRYFDVTEKNVNEYRENYVKGALLRGSYVNYGSQTIVGTLTWLWPGKSSYHGSIATRSNRFFFSYTVSRQKTLGQTKPSIP